MKMHQLHFSPFPTKVYGSATAIPQASNHPKGQIIYFNEKNFPSDTIAYLSSTNTLNDVDLVAYFCINFLLNFEFHKISS